MVLISLTEWIAAYAADQLVTMKYGAVGALALGLVAVGRKTRNTTCQCAGLVAWALLLAQ
jgi:hypothetical protein